MTTQNNGAAFLLHAESRLTERSQTTIPVVIRDALSLKPGEYIEYTLTAEGNVIMSRQQKEQSDPIVSQYLSFLADDMMNNPQNIRLVTVDFWEGIETLTAGIEVDLDAPLTDD